MYPNSNRPIKIALREILCEKFSATPEEKATALYAIQAYSHLLVWNGANAFSFGDFAKAIQRTYDANNPRNEEVIRVLQALHERGEAETALPA